MSEPSIGGANVLDPVAVAVVKAAHRLITTLESGQGVARFSDVLDLQRVLADLEVVERGKFNQEQREAIEHAAGLARTHSWELIDSKIMCTRCPVDASITAVTHGTVPECTPNTRCVPYAVRHFVVGARCVYCKTEYPATANDVGGGEW